MFRRFVVMLIALLAFGLAGACDGPTTPSARIAGSTSAEASAPADEPGDRPAAAAPAALPDEGANQRTAGRPGETGADGAPSAGDSAYQALESHREPGLDDGDDRVAVLLHGYGSNERDLVGLARRVGLRGPIVSFRAPQRAGRGYAWFPIDFGAQPRYQPDAADEVIELLAANLAAVRAESPGRRIVVLGFSQGATMAMMLAVEHPDVLDQAIALSGTIPRPPRPPKTFDPDTAPLIYAIHGTADDVVSLERGRQAQIWLEAAGAEPTYNEYEGMGHRVSPAVVADLRNYLSLPE